MTSKLKTDVLETVSGSGTIALTNQLSGMTADSVPSGSVLQVVSATKSDTQSVTGMTWTDVAGLAVSITPSSTSSKILVSVGINMSSTLRYAAFKMLRGSTEVGVGDAAGNRPRISGGTSSNVNSTGDLYLIHNSNAQYLDSPATTSATTYKVQFTNTTYVNAVTHVNRSTADANENYGPRGISTITLTEIKG